MPFCTKCGSEIQGRFCVKCGAPAEAPAAPPAAAPVVSAAGPSSLAAAAPAKKKISPLVWILVAVLGLFMLVGVAVVGAGVFFVHKAKQAGFDPELMKSNPGLAMTKMLTAMNPNVEVLHVDEGKGVITIRDKQTGETTTVDFEDIKKGRITFKDDKGEAVTFEAKGEGDNGSFSMKSGNESVTMGAGADVKVPSWIPAYPGVNVEGKYHTQKADGEAGAFGFTTTDPAGNVLNFYSQHLKSAGLNVNSRMTGDSGGIVGAEDESKARSVSVVVGKDGNGTSVAITYTIKK